MKIKKLNEDLQGVSDKVIVDKINEIIDVLNSSFITLDPDTSLDILDSLTSVSSIQCDRLTPLANETINIQEHYDNCVWEPKGLYDDVVCPACHNKYFSVEGSSTTLLHCPTIIKDGVVADTVKNTTETKYQCHVCGHRWKETT